MDKERRRSRVLKKIVTLSRNNRHSKFCMFVFSIDFMIEEKMWRKKKLTIIIFKKKK